MIEIIMLKNRIVHWFKMIFSKKYRNEFNASVRHISWRVKNNIYKKLASQKNIQNKDIEDHNYVDGFCTFCGKPKPQ